MTYQAGLVDLVRDMTGRDCQVRIRELSGRIDVEKRWFQFEGMTENKHFFLKDVYDRF